MIYLIFAFYILCRVYPYALSNVPNGYDAGIYLYLWKEYSKLSFFEFNKLPNWLVEVYPPLIGIFGKIISLFTNSENIIIPVSIVLPIFLFTSVYLFAKEKFSKNISLWIMFVFSISAIQYKFWWWYYLKNSLALSLVFLYLYLDLKNNKFKYLLPVFIVLLHQPTAILFFLILLLNKKINEIILFLATFLIYYIPNYEHTIKPYFIATSTVAAYESETFYGLFESIKYMLLYIPFAVFGLAKTIKSKINNWITWIYLITFLIPLFGLFLSRRFIPFFDIFTIIFAGIGLSVFFDNKNKINKKFYIVLLIIFSLTFVFKNSNSLINSDEFDEIKLLSKTEYNSKILITDNEYSSWVYGYSNRTTIAPGLGENDIYWNANEWQEYWLSANQNREIELLSKIPKPLYIWKGDKNQKTKFSLESDCFEKYSWHVYKFICN